MSSFHQISIKSYKGVYLVDFIKNPFELIKELSIDNKIIIDENVMKIYRNKFDFDHKNVLVIEALEKNKSFDCIGGYIQELINMGLKRDQKIIAIGGGIIQDITCFIASTLFRGVSWSFFPTTLLAQADSCIGSKSSINFGKIKNLLGTFNPPKEIFIANIFLESLKQEDIQSGIGEIIKVHIIDGKDSFVKLKSDYEGLSQNMELLQSYIKKALMIKKYFIEEDEFDQHIRNVMNYGHSFGHAIESATEFKIPHGVSVTIGMNIANYLACKMNRIDSGSFELYCDILRDNISLFSKVKVPMDKFYQAMAKDKKNTGSLLNVILIRDDGPIEKIGIKKDQFFDSTMEGYFELYQR